MSLKVGDSPDWALFVKWRAKLFMQSFLTIQKFLVTNVTAVPLELIIWELLTLRNVLLELQLVKPTDLDKKPTNFFQKVALMGKFYLPKYRCFTIIFQLKRQPNVMASLSPSRPLSRKFFRDLRELGGS